MLVDKTNTKLVPFFPQNLPENRVKFSVLEMFLFMSTNMAAVTTGANWHWCLTSYKQHALSNARMLISIQRKLCPIGQG